jgi:hypothetical protein
VVEPADTTNNLSKWLQDKINAFWEITKKDLEDRKAEMRNQDRQMEETEDLHQRELKVQMLLQAVLAAGSA